MNSRKTASVSFRQITGTSIYYLVAEYKGAKVYDDFGSNTLVLGCNALIELKRQGFTHVKQESDNKQGFTIKKIGQ